MFIQEKQYTTQDWWEFINLPENADKHFELIHGEFREKVAASFIPSALAAKILIEIGIYLKSNDVGYVTTSDGSYELTDTDTYMPDVGFIRKERLPEIPSRYVKVPPDLAVEVVSPTDVLADTHLKAMQYISAGTKLVWVVYPAKKIINVYRPAENGANVQTLGIEGVLSGEDVLPNFQLAIKEIFSILE